MNTPGLPSSGPFPRPEDEHLTRGKAYLESASWQQQGQPPQWGLLLRGSLPTPCHEVRVQIAPPTADGRVFVQVYSVSPPDTLCVQQISLFEVFVPLPFGPEEGYRIYLNKASLEDLSSKDTR